MSVPAPRASGIRIWDLPTRLFHWLLVVLIVLLYATGDYGLLDMNWHFWFGYATVALLIFRLLWGFLGSQTSRFASFVRGPRAVVSYVRESYSAAAHSVIGHNPLGGWSVIALLVCVMVQAISGLFSSDEIEADGPLVSRVSNYSVRLMTRVHHWNQNLLLLLVALHVGAILIYLLVKHDNLVVPMITGRKPLAEPASLRFASAWLALALLLVSIAAVVAFAVYAG